MNCCFIFVIHKEDLIFIVIIIIITVIDSSITQQLGYSCE